MKVYIVATQQLQVYHHSLEEYVKIQYATLDKNEIEDIKRLTKIIDKHDNSWGHKRYLANRAHKELKDKYGISFLTFEELIIEELELHGFQRPKPIAYDTTTLDKIEKNGGEKNEQ